MNLIDDRTAFSRPRILSSSPHRQVVRFDSRVSRDGKKAGAIDCVLKFFTSKVRIAYDKEVAAYSRLTESNTTLRFPQPLGFGEWSSAKYAKVLGKGRQTLLEDDPDSTIFVLMLEYIGNSHPLSVIMPIAPEITILALSSLADLHAIGIVHGDISTTNILVIEKKGQDINVAWVDFSSSWTNASSKQIEWELDRAAEYFEEWVYMG